MKIKDSVLLPIAIFCVGFTVLFIVFIVIVAGSGKTNKATLNYTYNEEEETATVKSPDQKIEYYGNIVIPESVEHNGKTYRVTGIEDYAFYDCDRIKSITIPHTITKTWEGCEFNDCDSLEAINVAVDNPNYCSIDGVVFSKDSTALSVYPGGKKGDYVIPDFVTEIKWEGNFSRCRGVTSITIPKSVTNIDYNLIAIRSYNLSAINVVPENPNYCSIDGVLFSKDLTQLIKYPANKPDSFYVVPCTVSSIGKWAFNGSKNLRTVTIPSSVDSICEVAFYETSIDSVYLSYGLRFIGHGAFMNCDLQSISIPNSVTKIEGWALNTSGLKVINIPASVTSLALDAFDGFIMEINVAKDNPNFSSLDGVLLNKDKSILLKCPYNKNRDGYTIPKSVKHIEDGAFLSSWVKTLYCKPVLPPLFNESPFDHVDTLYVPMESVEAYKNSKWGEIRDINIVGYSFK